MFTHCITQTINIELSWFVYFFHSVLITPDDPLEIYPWSSYLGFWFFNVLVLLQSAMCAFS